MEELKIEYGSLYEFMNLLKKHPMELGVVHTLYSKAQKEVDDLRMELEILTAEIVDEICTERTVPPSAKSELRRAEVQLDNRWKKMSKKLNIATEKANILFGRLQGLYARRAMLEKLADFEKRLTYSDRPIYKNPISAMEGVELPDE